MDANDKRKMEAKNIASCQMDIRYTARGAPMTRSLLNWGPRREPPLTRAPMTQPSLTWGPRTQPQTQMDSMETATTSNNAKE